MIPNLANRREGCHGHCFTYMVLLLRWCRCTPRLSSSDEPSHRKHGTTKVSDLHQPHVLMNNVAHAIGRAYYSTPRVLVRATNLASAQTQIWGTLISISSPPQASPSQDSGKASAHGNPKSSECSKSPRIPSADRFCKVLETSSVTAILREERKL